MKVYPERARLLLPQIGCNAKKRYNTPFMPDDHSELVPPLPIPNRTVKRLHANDSADTRVKVGNRQAPHSPLKTEQRAKTPPRKGGVFAFLLTYK